MKNLILCIIMQGLLLSFLTAQDLQVISAGGVHAEGSQGSVNYTIGECIVVPFEGATATLSSGFHQGEDCPAQNIVGEIDGCALLCPGDLDHSYTYSVTPYPNLTDFEWIVTPDSAAVIINSTETSVELKFPNRGLTSAILEFIPTDECNEGLPVEFEIAMDTACVWPGDVNNDGIVEWGTDEPLFFFALAVYNNMLNSSPTPPIRTSPCFASSNGEWEANPAQSWDEAYNFIDITTGITYNAKYADTNGDGAIEDDETNGYLGTLPLPPNFTDSDAIFGYGNLDNGTYTHSGNSHKGFYTAPNIFIEAQDSVLMNGDELRLTIKMGTTSNPISNIHNVALITRFSLGTYNNPVAQFDDSHLAPYSFLRTSANYFGGITVDTVDADWYLAIGRKTLTTRNFAGENLCNLICEVPVAGLYDPNGQGNKLNGLSSYDTTEVIISIPQASYITHNNSHQNQNFELKSLQGNSTTVYIVSFLELEAKAYLGGPFVDDEFIVENNDTIYLQSDRLRELSLIPLQEPYSPLGYVYQGGGGESIRDSVLETTGRNAIVDWVILELRDKTDFTQLIHSRAVLLQRDGDIVDLDGVSPVKFREVPNEDYYLLLRHRNHLPVMSSTPVQLKRGVKNNHDFTKNNACYNNHAWQRLDSVWALFPSDADTNCAIDGLDKAACGEMHGSFNQYVVEDFNMDGSVDGNDNITWSQCNGIYTNIPCD